MFKIEFTDEFDEEIQQVYNYISYKLIERESANRLISIIYERISNLQMFPRLYMKIGKLDRLHNEYHRMVVNNYIILYTVDDLNKKIFISHIYYKRKNYL